MLSDGKLLLIDSHEIGFKLQPTGAQTGRLFFYDTCPVAPGMRATSSMPAGSGSR